MCSTWLATVFDEIVDRFRVEAARVHVPPRCSEITHWRSTCSIGWLAEPEVDSKRQRRDELRQAHVRAIGLVSHLPTLPEMCAQNRTVTTSPPSGRAVAVSSASCATAIARTIDRPSP